MGRTMMRTAIRLMLILALAVPCAWADYTEVDWVELMPEEDLEAIKNMPMPSHESDQAVTLPEEVLAGRVVPGFDGREVRIRGFVVPLTHDEDQRVTEFFLVPYYGACIHVPPPPPNQIIHVQYPEGFRLDTQQIPFGIEGTLRVHYVSNDVAEASYVMEADSVNFYQ